MALFGMCNDIEAVSERSLQHTDTRWNTLQNSGDAQQHPAAPEGNIREHVGVLTFVHFNTLQHTGNTLQYIGNTLQELEAIFEKLDNL